jgi:hypothetical protein
MDVDDHAMAESFLMMLGDDVGVRQDIDASPRVGRSSRRTRKPADHGA